VAELTDISPLSQLMRRIDAQIVEAPARDTVSTGFPSVDQLLGGGVRGGDLVVLGGDIGSGKSAFALAVALRGALAGAPVAFYTGEMTVERVLERMLALDGRARVDDLRRGGLDDFTRASVGAAVLRLRELSPVVERMPDGVDALVESVRARSGLRLAVVDSLQSLARGRTTLDEELAGVVRTLKTLAVDLGIGIILLAELPGLPPIQDRARPDRRPTLDDFGVLHAVKQHADVVLGLYREEMYQNSQSVDGATELLALKNRGGPTGYVDLYFYKQWMRFEDLLER
jgi:replicative DNA helicase